MAKKYIVTKKLGDIAAGGPGSGWRKPPYGTHVPGATAGARPRYQVGITSARPEKTTEQIAREMAIPEKAKEKGSEDK